MADDGQIVLPAAISLNLGVKPGEMLMAHVSEDTIVIETVDASIRRAQAMVRRYIPVGAPLVDELIAERRAAAARE